MEYKTLTIKEEEGILIVHIDRPKSLNAINSDVMNDLHRLFDSGIDFDNTIGIIITGTGDKAFAAGADITEFDSLNVKEGSALSKKGHDVFGMIENCVRPVLAAVNGFSLGGGNELAMSCHIRIASENAKFGQPEVNLGLIPGYGGTQRLIQYIGKGRAMELLLTGDMIDAETALRYGLVTHVTTSEELIDTAKKILQKIGQKGPEAVTKIIEGVNSYFDKEEDGFAKEIRDFGYMLTTDQCKEGVSAFLEKRKPEFKKQ